jgi:hypothetical protein
MYNFAVLFITTITLATLAQWTSSQDNLPFNHPSRCGTIPALLYLDLNIVHK